ncbi:MAG: ankyrin repeat domain-containing protein [Akkermansia sp.]|nr:ankyrin repeat domain-containing protein [Akkermansia sp.]
MLWRFIALCVLFPLVTQCSSVDWYEVFASGKTERIGAALDGGADINRACRTIHYEGSTFTLTPLHQAMCYYVGGPTVHEEKGVEIVRYLISRGADVNARIPEDGRTPLHLAAGSLDATEAPLLYAALLEAGADASIRDNRGRTAEEVRRETAEINREIRAGR